MKQIIAVFALLAVTLAADWHLKSVEELAADRKECYESEHIDETNQEAIEKGHYAPEPGCYYRCIGLKADIWDDAEGFHSENTYELMKSEGFELSLEGLKKCNADTEKDADPCKYAASITKCAFEGGHIKNKE